MSINPLAPGAQPGAYPPAAPARRLYDVINIPLCGLVVLCFFLPLSKLECGPMTVNFTGTNIGLGTTPSMGGMEGLGGMGGGRGMGGDMGDMGGGGMPGMGGKGKGGNPFGGPDGMQSEPLLLLMPVAALVGLVVAGAAAAQKFSPPAALAAAGPGVAALVLVFFLVVGFKHEREIKDGMAKEMSKAPKGGGNAGADEFAKAMMASISVGKTPAYWLALLAAIGATALGLMRDQSPLMASGPNAPGPYPAYGPPPVPTPVPVQPPPPPFQPPPSPFDKPGDGPPSD